MEKGLKIMSYNILSGGETPLGKITNRRKKIQNVISVYKPDILSLLECNGWIGNSRILQEYESKFDMKGYILGTKEDPDGNAYNITILVRNNIPVQRVMMESARFWHGVVAVDVTSHSGKLLRFITTHLAPQSPNMRLQEAETITKSFGTKERCMIMGDLNSLSFHDGYTVAQMPPKEKSRHVTDGFMDTRTIQHFEEVGYIDVFNYMGSREYTAPTVSAIDPAFEKAKLRLDYFLASQDLRPYLDQSVAKVIRDCDADYASDHFPIFLSLNI